MSNPRAPLPVWGTVKDAYLDVLRHWRLALRASAVWVAVIVLVQGGWYLATGADMAAVARGEATSPVLLQLALLALWTLAFAAVAVFWHRRLLLGEQAVGVAAPLDRPVGRYLLYLAMIGLFVVIPALLIVIFGGLFGAMGGMAQESEGFAAVTGTIVGLITVAVSLALVARMQLVLPAAATGKAMTLGESFKHTQGQTLRLVGSMLLQGVIAVPITLLLGLLALPLALLGLEIGLLIVSTLANVFFALVGAAWLSLAYRRLTA